jgi:hypothetical protein
LEARTGMSTKKATPDRSKITADDKDEIKYWAKHFGVTPEELHSVIDTVGNSAAAVRKELGNRQAKPDPAPGHKRADRVSGR